MSTPRKHYYDDDLKKNDGFKALDRNVMSTMTDATINSPASESIYSRLTVRHYYDNENSPLVGGGGAKPRTTVWIDGWYDCFRHGLCHASLWNALCCPQLLMGQVLTRMGLNLMGDPHHIEKPLPPRNLAFRQVRFLLILSWALAAIVSPPPVYVDLESGTWIAPPSAWWQRFAYNGITIAFGLYTLVVLTKLRAAVRERDGIAVRVPVVEDFCCAFWCGCCTVAQLARQTTNYEQQQGSCCSATGIYLSQDDDEEEYVEKKFPMHVV